MRGHDIDMHFQLSIIDGKCLSQESLSCVSWQLHNVAKAEINPGINLSLINLIYKFSSNHVRETVDTSLVTGDSYVVFFSHLMGGYSVVNGD